MTDQQSTSSGRSVTNRLFDQITGYWLSQAIYVMAKLEVADRLSEQPQSCDDLAEQIGCDADALFRLLRALAAHGISKEHAGRKFSATPGSDALCRHSPNSLWALAVMLGEEHYVAWGKLLEGVRRGTVPFELTFGQPIFEYFDRNPASAAVFHRAMIEHAQLTHLAAVEAYDFGSVRQVADIGGGHGTLLAMILQKNPHLHGILFDLPDVVAGADNGPLAQQGVRDRCDIIGGDFFQAVPEGADLYIMSTVIHDWHDEAACRILNNVRDAMADDARLVLVERVLRAPNQPDSGKMADLNMLVMTGGRERSEEEYRELLAASGLRMLRVIPTRAESSLIEAAAE